MERIYRITLHGGQEFTTAAKDVKEAREIAKSKYNGSPVVQTVFDVFRSDLGNDSNQKKKELSEKMQKLAFEFVDFIREAEKDGVEEMVEYKFFSNLNHCHVGLTFSSLVDEHELKEKAAELYEAITESYLSEKEKIALIVNNVKTIDVFSDKNAKVRFTLNRKKSHWEKTNYSDSNFTCILDGSKKDCDKCDDDDCFALATMLNDREILNLLENNSFEVKYYFNTTKDLIIAVYLT